MTNLQKRITELEAELAEFRADEADVRLDRELLNLAADKYTAMQVKLEAQIAGMKQIMGGIADELNAASIFEHSPLIRSAVSKIKVMIYQDKDDWSP